MAVSTEIVGEFATDYRKYHLVDDKAKKEHQSWEQAYRVSRPQTRLAGVAEPSEPASGLIADVWGVQDGKAEKVRESQRHTLTS